ncbi:MAG: hypothetical protein JNK60_14465 [Acidobacteria bacterium]|nr:hypothetical protein [Acidobacteriota bacterium]
MSGGGHHHREILPLLPTYDPPAELDGLGKKGLIVGFFALIATLVGGLMANDHFTQFYRSYLIGFLFVFALSAGCWSISLVHHLSRGKWGVMIRRSLEAAAANLPLVAVMFVPIVFGIHSLYEWSHTEVVAGDPILSRKAAYLNANMFILRSAFYFVSFSLLAMWIRRLSLKQDQTGDPALAPKMQKIAAGSLLFYILAMTFAAVDWVMSLTPHWFSTIYGLYFVIGQGIAGMAFTILMCKFLSKLEPLAKRFSTENFHDYGKLLFAWTLVWTYFSLSQFLIIWSGNLPEELSWFYGRIKGGWKPVSLMLVFLHFVLPFLLLLSRSRKQNITRLARVAALMLFMRLVDLIWLTAPAFSPDVLKIHWMDITAPIGLFGIWLFFYVRNLRSRSILPLHEPYLREALGHV